MVVTNSIDLGTSPGESSQRYAARMVYLSEEDDGGIFGSTGGTLEPMGRTLKPPVLFMSRRQARADSALCAVRQQFSRLVYEYEFVLHVFIHIYVIHVLQPCINSIFTDE